MNSALKKSINIAAVFPRVILSLITVVIAWMAAGFSLAMELDLPALFSDLGFKNISPFMEKFLILCEHVFQVGLISFAAVAFASLAIALLRNENRSVSNPFQIGIILLTLFGIAYLCFNPDSQFKAKHPGQEWKEAIGIPVIYIFVTVVFSGWLLFRAYKSSSATLSYKKFFISFLGLISSMILIAIVVNAASAWAIMDVAFENVKAQFNPIALTEKTMMEMEDSDSSAIYGILRIKSFIPTFESYLFSFFAAWVTMLVCSFWNKDESSLQSQLGMLILWTLSIILTRGATAKEELIQDKPALLISIIVGTLLIIGFFWLFNRRIFR